MHEHERAAMYDPMAAAYELHATHSAYNAYYDRPALLDLVGDVTGLRVLDAGCGPGLLAAELVARGARVTALDESEKMVQLAGRRLGPDVEVRRQRLGERADWLDDASMDLAVMALVLHHLDDRVAALREIARVLTPAGRLVLSTIHPVSDWLRYGGSYFDVEAVEDTWQDDWQVHFWRQPLEAWCEEFNAAGFLVERLVEPRPVAAMAQTHPDVHEKHNHEPALIAFRLVKAR
jgi:SAM-dependent methyltransferase